VDCRTSAAPLLPLRLPPSTHAGAGNTCKTTTSGAARLVRRFRLRPSLVKGGQTISADITMPAWHTTPPRTAHPTRTPDLQYHFNAATGRYARMLRDHWWHWRSAGTIYSGVGAQHLHTHARAIPPRQSLPCAALTTDAFPFCAPVRRRTSVALPIYHMGLHQAGSMFGPTIDCSAVRPSPMPHDVPTPPFAAGGFTTFTIHAAT